MRQSELLDIDQAPIDVTTLEKVNLGSVQATIPFEIRQTLQESISGRVP